MLGQQHIECVLLVVCQGTCIHVGLVIHLLEGLFHLLSGWLRNIRSVVQYSVHGTHRNACSFSNVFDSDFFGHCFYPFVFVYVILRAPYIICSYLCMFIQSLCKTTKMIILIPVSCVVCDHNALFWGKFTIKNRIVRMHSVFFAIKTKKKSFLFLYSRKKAYFCPMKISIKEN